MDFFNSSYSKIIRAKLGETCIFTCLFLFRLPGIHRFPVSFPTKFSDLLAKQRIYCQGKYDTSVEKRNMCGGNNSQAFPIK